MPSLPGIYLTGFWAVRSGRTPTLSIHSSNLDYLVDRNNARARLEDKAGEEDAYQA